MPNTPTFGLVEDEEELEGDEKIPVVQFTAVGYDALPDADGAREMHSQTFHARPVFRSERVLAAFARGERGEIDVQSLAKMIFNMIVTEERNEFLDFIENVNLTFAPKMFEDVVEYLVEEASNRPKELSSGSSNGQTPTAGKTSTGARSGRALSSGKSR